MSTREDREHDEREEYGYGHPLDGGFSRMSAIIADRFAPIEYADSPQPVDNEDETPNYDQIVADLGFDPLQELPGQSTI